RQPQASAWRGPVVPADGARLRTVHPSGPAGRRCRHRARPGDLRARHPQGRAPDRAARLGRRTRIDRSDAHVTEQLVEPMVETPELPPILPVLPLKETVVFPESMTPLAIG